MWPFTQKTVIIRSPQIKSYDEACSKLKEVCENLEARTEPTLTDSEILVAYCNVKSQMQSNCDSVAQGLFTAVADICAHRPHLASEILPDPLKSLYYLGIEELDGIKMYIRWLIDYDKPYHGRASESGYRYLRELMEQDRVIVEAFRSMFSQEKNDWREHDEDVPTIPRILASEQDGTSNGG